MKLIADTSTLISPAEGKAMGIEIIPICVSIDGTTYQDYAQITGEQFLQYIEEGSIPSSSQPAIGDYLDILESGDEEMLFLTVGDGLSGAYQTAMSARNMVNNPERIHIVNSKTLAGPMRYLAQKAVMLREQGLSAGAIAVALESSIESSVSFVIPEDFQFLKRSGRVTNMTARIGGILKLLPILTQTKDKTRITPVSVRRGWNAAVDVILQRLEELHIGANHLVTVCHAGTPEKAETIAAQVAERFPVSEIEVLPLSPALMTHGGPGCIVIQAILK
ncbi:MAG: DegV family protein [Clostridia bacterium]|nr:DegV family protein [Clostridia bacterium]